MHEVDAQRRAPRANAAGQALRTTLQHYFNSDAGSVPWQLRILDLEPRAYDSYFWIPEVVNAILNKNRLRHTVQHYKAFQSNFLCHDGY